jgi:hypothetical protein
MDDFGTQSAIPATGLTMSNVNGVLPVRTLSQLQAAEKEQATEANSRSYITNLAGHIRTKWDVMRTAKMQTVEKRLLQCLRQRRGEYEEDKIKQIRDQGGSDIYMMLSSNKSRALSSWIRDTTSSEQDGAALPFTLNPTPVPDIPPNIAQRAYATMQQELQQAAAMGIIPSDDELEEYVEARKEMIVNHLREEAQEAADRMKMKMNDQLAEGGCGGEFQLFVDDLATFPYAVMKGPVVVKRKTFKWVPGVEGNFDLQTVDELIPTWVRVDPFNIYWAPHASHPDHGDMIERHKLTRQALNSLIGVEGYSEKAIRAVLDDYGRGGLAEWLWVDAQKAVAEGKSLSAVTANSDGLIDALQFWGSVQGKVLIEWGIDEGSVEDPLAEYPVEAWLIGNWVIKATINPDPLGRKPYYKACYEEVPGAWAGNSPLDLIRDCQDMCNASARALANNMGIASGPQVWMNIDRLPHGEEITQMYPWKIWQFSADPLGNSSPPVDFFQPTSLSQELMTIYDRFSALADEFSGVPRYMTGDAAAGGAGRTASGMSMMMNNAGKSIKQVIANIDRNVIEPLVERLWFYNMKYSEDMDLKGDVKIVARGASALMVKEAAAQRRNELLQIALSNPVAQQIMGLEGTAYLLREQVKTLDMNADKIVPPPEVVKAKAQMQQAMQQQQQMMAMQQPDETMSIKRDAEGNMTHISKRTRGGPVSNPNQQLQNGAPVTDTFSPMATS